MAEKGSLLSPVELAQSFRQALEKRDLVLVADFKRKVNPPEYFNNGEEVGAFAEIGGLELLPGSRMDVGEVLAYFGITDPKALELLTGQKPVGDKPLVKVKSRGEFFEGLIYGGARNPAAQTVGKLGSMAIDRGRPLDTEEATIYQTAYGKLSPHLGKPTRQIRQEMGLDNDINLTVVPEDCVASVVSAVTVKLLMDLVTDDRPNALAIPVGASSLQSLVLLAELADATKTLIRMETGRIVGGLSRGDPKTWEHANYLETTPEVDGPEVNYGLAVGDVGDNGKRYAFAALGIEPPQFDRYRIDHPDLQPQHLDHGALITRTKGEKCNTIVLPLLRGGYMAQGMREFFLSQQDEKDGTIVGIRASRVTGIDKGGEPHFGVVLNNPGADLKQVLR